MENETRAVSAEHGKLTPLIVLVPSVATVILATVALILMRPLGPLVLIGGVAASIAVGCRFYGTRLVVGTVLLTVLAGVVGVAFLVVYGIGTALGCVEEPSGWWFVGAIGGATLLYLVLGMSAFRARYPLLAVAGTLVLSLITLIAVMASAPQITVPDCSS